jgi:raffinose/stachyose/melibiose transport system permease protein
VTVVLIGIAAALWLVPIVYMVDVSFRLPWEVFDAAVVSPSFTTGNYQQVLADNPLPVYFMNSIIVSVSTTALVVAGATAFAFAVSVLRVRWSRIIYSLVLLTLMVPIAALVVPVAQELKHLGWTNTHIGLIAPYTALGIPFATVILVNIMDELPEEIHEAAVIDGAGAVRLLIHVVVPMVRPAIVFVAIWQFITSWNEFFLALTVMTRDSAKTLPLIPQQYSGVYLSNPAALFAILTLVAMPLIILYLLVQRWFVGGLLEGAVKG